METTDKKELDNWEPQIGRGLFLPIINLENSKEQEYIIKAQI